MLKSLFITGTDTDVGKTYITAGLAVVLRKMGMDVGVMKPFAAGAAQKKGYKSEDVEILSRAANTHDPEDLVNPQFFPIPASPYTAWKKLKTKPKVSTVLSSFKKLSKLHDMLLVEGMGGIMTPILKIINYDSFDRDFIFLTHLYCHYSVIYSSNFTSSYNYCGNFHFFDQICNVIVFENRSHNSTHPLYQ